MQEGLIMAAQLILGLSILVGLHELGHLLAAKMFGMRVEKYSIGFPPKIYGIKWGDTEYSIGAVPLGGFVKISGMVDESLDTKDLNKAPEPWEFRAKPAWQRLIVMMGGIIVNVITGVVIFIFLTYSQGDEYLSKEELNKRGIAAGALAKEIGLASGDKIIKINGSDYSKLRDLSSTDVLLEDNSTYTVNRNGEVFKVTIPSGFMEKFSDESNGGFIDPRMTFEVGQIMEGSPAEKAELKPGDKIVSVGGVSITYFDELRDNLAKNKGKATTIDVLRDNQVKQFNVTVGEDGKLGFSTKMEELNFSTTEYSFAEAIPVGTVKAFSVVWVNVKALGKIFKGEISPTKSLSGPIEIARRLYGGIWDWGRFWNITGLLSMVLAFMNFLPIPALDGGHVMFLTFEILSGRAPSDKFLEVAQKVGMVLLLALMAFAIGNDIVKVVSKYI